MSWNAWTREDLAEKRIFYDETIPTPELAEFPPHVQRFRSTILDFSCSTLELISEKDEARPHAELRGAYGIRNKALDLTSGGYSEKHWEGLFESNFFSSIISTPGDSRRYWHSLASLGTELTSSIEGPHAATTTMMPQGRRVGDTDWDLFGFRATEADTAPLGDFERLKCPKPDYAFFLPIYYLEEDPKMPKVEFTNPRKWHQSPNNVLVESFSWSLLKDLYTHGLRPTPFLVFNRKPQESKLMCYPWLVVEHKKEDITPTTVCCQAANASACAVKISQVTARYAVEQPDSAHVPPIPVVTTIGPQVRVWVMHFAKSFVAPTPIKWTSVVEPRKHTQGYIMRHIWNGDMTKIEDVVKFQLILENIHTWAMRVFKPLISSYIDLWKLVHSNSSTSVADAALVRRQQLMERCQTGTPIVQGILDHLSSVQLSGPESAQITPLLIGLLIQQVQASERQLLVQEVDRIVTERIGALRSEGAANPEQHSANDTYHAKASRDERDDTTDYGESKDAESVDGDDGNDSDYQASQATTLTRAVTPVGETSESRVNLRSSTRRNANSPLTSQASTASNTSSSTQVPDSPSTAQTPPSPETPKATRPILIQDTPETSSLHVSATLGASDSPSATPSSAQCREGTPMFNYRPTEIKTLAIRTLEETPGPPEIKALLIRTLEETPGPDWDARLRRFLLNNWPPNSVPNWEPTPESSTSPSRTPQTTTTTDGNNTKADAGASRNNRGWYAQLQ
ncbi:hypothetical protein NM208_g2604 [Fusarium decemcellulare]|uniref:Uncharacterized protein n=1 Tax=Fusarium decemcellulare TaxID=57161 RepID=A0ACC1SSJ2_9HYPO|nr:hypothetical protein NM208_g2604 [Fusarium decemcellulare]